MIQNAKADQILALVEAAANVVLYQTFCLKPSQAKKLKPHLRRLRILGKESDYERAREQVQKGGGGYLSSLLIPVLTEAATLLLKR